MHTFLKNWKQTSRSLARERGLFLAAVLCLGLGIGTQTVALELLDALLLRPPVGIEDAAGLHRLYLTSTSEGVERTVAAYPYPVIAALRRADVFDDLAGSFSAEIVLDSEDVQGKQPAVFVDEAYFRVLTVTPRYGRVFDEPEADPAGSAFVVVLSHGAAARLFGEAAGALGASLSLGGERFEVIGVLPEGFHGIGLDRTDFFLPMSAAGILGFSPNWHTKTNSWFLRGLVRDEQAANVSAPTADRILREVLGEEMSIRFGAIQAVRAPDSPVQAGLFWGLVAAAGLVLLIACMVVASLFMVRHLHRRSELGIRMALGAGSGDIFRIVLREAFLIALLSGLVAVFVAVAEGRLFRGLVLPDTAALAEPALGRVLIITLVLVAAVTLICGLLPALRLRGRDVTRLLKSERQVGGLGRIEEVLLALQVGFATMALIAVGWFVLSVVEIRSLDLGLDPERVALVTFESAKESPETVAELARRAEARLREVPSVEAVGRAVGIPLSSSLGVSVGLPDRDVPELETGGPYLNAVSPDFFEALGTRIVRGRGFREDDEHAGAEPVVVINETVADYFFPGFEPLGQCLELGDQACVRIVGVAQDARRMGLREGATFQLYVPTTQAPGWFGPARNLFVRWPPETGNEQLLKDAVVSVAGESVVEVRRLSAFLEGDLRPFRIGTSLLSLFASLALFLILLGMYAALARFVGSRTREIGVRLALGAKRRAVVSLVTLRTLRFVLPGLILGGLLGLWAGAFVEPLLFEISSRDPRVFLSAALLLLIIAMLASLGPVARACRISPSEALSNR